MITCLKCSKSRTASPLYFMQIIIKKPLYKTKDGVVVGVYNKRIEDALTRKENVDIQCGQYRGVFKAKWIQKNCPIIEKIFLRPDEPMKLYKVFLKKTKKEIRMLAELGVFG